MRHESAYSQPVLALLGFAFAAGVFVAWHGAQAAQVSSRSDMLSNSQPSATSNHTIAFTPNNAIYGSSTTGSSTVKVTFPQDFTIPSNLNCGDIDAATSTQFPFNYPACQQTTTAWGMSVTNAISFVQQNAANAGAAKYNVISFNSPNTAGNLIVLVANTDNSVTVQSVTDTLGNVYTSAIGPFSQTGSSLQTQIFYAKNIKSGMNTVSVKLSGDQTLFEVYIHEYSGADPNSPLDAVSASSAASGTAMNSGTATTHFTNELIFAAGFANTVSAPGTGFASRSTLDTNITEDKSVTSAGSYNATATGDGSNWSMLMATFKSAPSITLIPPTNGGEYVATGTPITINIGSNATYQQTGTHWITNPSAGGTYNISVGGTFGGYGNIPVAITSGVTLQGIIPETLSFTVTPSQSTTTTITYQPGGSGAGSEMNTSDHYTQSGLTLTQGWLVVVMVTQLSGHGPLGAGVTDSKGNSYAKDVTDNGSYPGWNSYIYHTIVASGKDGAGISITYTSDTSPSSDYIDMHVLAFSAANGWTTLPLDRSNHTGGGSQPASPVTLTAGTTAQMELMVGHFGDGNGGSPSSADNWTRTFLVDSNMSASFYKTATTVTSVSFRVNDSGNVGYAYDQLVATYMPILPTNCTADDGATVNAINTTATSVPFGFISSNTFYQGCQDLAVSTNASGGYSLTVQEKTAMQTANGLYSIPDTTCDASNCSAVTATTWVTPTKNGLGHTCYNVSGSDCNASFLNGTKFKPVPNVPPGTVPGTLSIAATDSGTNQGSSFFTSVTSAGVASVTGWTALVACRVSDTTVTFSAPTDTAGNAYNLLSGPIGATGAWSDQIALYYSKNIKGNPNNKVACNFSSDDHNSVIVLYVAGADASAPLDVAAQSPVYSSAATATSNAWSTSDSNEIVLACMTYAGNFETFSAGNIAGVAATLLQTTLDLGCEYRILSSPAINQTASMSISGTWYDPAILVAGFRASGTPTFIMSNAGPAASTSRAKFRLSVAPSQAAGVYTTVITYTILGTF